MAALVSSSAPCGLTRAHAHTCPQLVLQILLPDRNGHGVENGSCTFLLSKKFRSRQLCSEKLKGWENDTRFLAQPVCVVENWKIAAGTQIGVPICTTRSKICRYHLLEENAMRILKEHLAARNCDESTQPTSYRRGFELKLTGTSFPSMKMAHSDTRPAAAGLFARPLNAEE